MAFIEPAQEPQGCDHCKHPLYAGIKCRVCGRATQPPQDHFPDATKMVQEPFGYFRAEPFGWTDCAATDEGAIPLYTRPPAHQPLTVERLRDALVASRIVPPAAVEDPDGYDDGVTLHRIEALHRRLA